MQERLSAALRSEVRSEQLAVTRRTKPEWGARRAKLLAAGGLNATEVNGGRSVAEGNPVPVCQDLVRGRS
jgi:hypothetical protein